MNIQVAYIFNSEGIHNLTLMQSLQNINPTTSYQ